MLFFKKKGKLNLANFYHTALWSPVLSTLQLAIENDNFISWSGITKINFLKYIDDTLVIDKVHLNQEQKNL